MVNASLNWASIVGIVLAVGGALLYFMRTFKPALARDYDVFFAAIGLLCGGILFFQGWRLDPILQFGQFLLAGTTIFFAYESVRLRGISTEQARRSAYFDDDQPVSPQSSNRLRDTWNREYDRFGEPHSVKRQFANSRQFSGEDYGEEDIYSLRRNPQPAIPEKAASRRFTSSKARIETTWSNEKNEEDKRARQVTRYDQQPVFGDRRRRRDKQRQSSSRPAAAATNSRIVDSSLSSSESGSNNPSIVSTGLGGISRSRGTPLRSKAEDASFSPITSTDIPQRPTPRSSRLRDNSSRFDS